MAGVTTTRNLLFMLMLGASYSRPTKKGYPTQGGGLNANPHVYVPVSPGPYGGPGHGSPLLIYPQSSIGSGPGLPYSSQAGVAPPVYAGYVGSYPIIPNTGPAATHDVDRLKASPHPPPAVEGSPHPAPAARGVEPRAGGFNPHGRSHSPLAVTDPAGLGSLYQAGELSHMKNTFEHGHYDTEREAEGVGRQQPGLFTPRMYLPIACHY